VAAYPPCRQVFAPPIGGPTPDGYNLAPMNLRIPAMGIAMAIFLAGPAAVAAAAPAEPPSPTPSIGWAPTFAPGAVLVGYTTDASVTTRAAARRSVAARAFAPLSRLAPDAERIALPAGTSVPQAIATLQRAPGVRYAEPDWLLRPTATSNDPAVTGGRTWGLYGASTSPNNAFGSDAMTAWAANRTGSRDIIVGVVDTGTDISHPDLKDNIFTNPGEIPGNGIDDDKNGYVDDTNGWDFHYNDRTVYDSANSDSHGTHVAGTIGAVGGNGIGVAGVNWQVTMVPAKFLGPNGGSLSNAVKALDYLTDLKRRHNLNLVASNNSWGGGGFSSTLQAAINRGGDAGILFVAAAGNSTTNNDATASYPSNYACTTETRRWDCVVAVASIASTGAISSFSSYGKTTVDLGAPGEGIYSTVPAGTYATYSGTSMATPHVTGAVALCRAAFPAMGADAVRSALLANTVATASLGGKTVTGGRLNAATMAAACAAQGPSGGGEIDAIDPDPVDPDPIETTPAPSAFNKTAPSNGRTGLGTNVKLTWSASANHAEYEVCVDRTNDSNCDAESWTKFSAATTSVTARVSTKTTYYWNVRAIGAGGTTQSNAGSWWRFSTK
jgi:subtilisin family serine protease